MKTSHADKCLENFLKVKQMCKTKKKNEKQHLFILSIKGIILNIWLSFGLKTCFIFSLLNSLLPIAYFSSGIFID